MYIAYMEQQASTVHAEHANFWEEKWEKER